MSDDPQYIATKRFVCIATMTLSIGLSACRKSDDVQTLEGRTITEVAIRYTGSKTVEEDLLKQFIGSKPGMRYSTEQLDEDLRELYESGLVEDIRFLSEPDGEGIRLVAEVLTRPPYGPLPFVGNTAFSDRKIADVSGLKSGGPATAEVIEAACRRIEQFYRQQGYVDATVTSELIQSTDPSLVDLQFQIVEGKQGTPKMPNKPAHTNPLPAPSRDLNENHNP